MENESGGFKSILDKMQQDSMNQTDRESTPILKNKNILEQVEERDNEEENPHQKSVSDFMEPDQWPISCYRPTKKLSRK